MDSIGAAVRGLYLSASGRGVRQESEDAADSIDLPYTDVEDVRRLETAGSSGASYGAGRMNGTGPPRSGAAPNGDRGRGGRAVPARGRSIGNLSQLAGKT